MSWILSIDAIRTLCPATTTLQIHHEREIDSIRIIGRPCHGVTLSKLENHSAGKHEIAFKLFLSEIMQFRRRPKWTR